MMKILYIGPYRNEMSVGYSSRNIIDSLCSVSDLTIRPIYVQNNNDYNMDSTNLIESENKRIEADYDVIIQHSTPNLLAPLYDVNSKTKNIAIPIINKTVNKKQYEVSLSGFDKILVDDQTTHSILTSSYMMKNVDMFSYNITEADDAKAYLDIHQDNHKFYFIGSFLNNKNIIKTIISSFYLTFSSETNISLILFITESSDHIQQEINKIVDSVRQELNIINPNYYHKIIINKLSKSNILAIHNSCDTYISLYDSGIESNFNKSIAQKYGKNIIDDTNTNMIYDVSQGYGDTYYRGELRLTTNTVFLSEAMIRSLQTKSNSTESATTIDKIICQ